MCNIKETRQIITKANKAQQLSKIVEEHNEFLDDMTAEESCDCTRAHMTYLENHCGGFSVNWKDHEEKMKRRNWETREKYDGYTVENASTTRKR